MHDQATYEVTQTAEPVQADCLAAFDPYRPTDHWQDRPPVGAFDPHFGSPSGGSGHDSRNFDEMMWEWAA
jgi:hypothetical protein